MRPSARKIVVAVLYGVAVALFLEGTARAVVSSDTLFRRIAGNDEASWRLRWVKRQGTGRRIYYAFDDYHPTRGWALRPNLREVPAFGGKTLSSNSRGLRGAREYSLDKPAGSRRIVVLGDSFTFGEDVGDDEAWPRQLGALMPGVEVLNLGVHGYGHDQMLLYLKEEGLRYHPDVVIVGFLPDDMERNVVAFRDYAKPRFVLQGGQLALRNVPVPTPDDVLAREPYRLKFLDLLSMLRGDLRHRSGRDQDAMRAITLPLLDEMNAAITAAGARAAFAYLPVYGEIDKPEAGMTGRERFFFSHWRQRGIQSMYLRPYFLEKLRGGAEFKTYGHWGPLEHRTVAEGVKAYLVEKALMPSPRP
ncbi:MAG TPA: GDSL-type esterase/lipase family protein [Vicinamibacteria bacterium]